MGRITKIIWKGKTYSVEAEQLEIYNIVKTKTENYLKDPEYQDYKEADEAIEVAKRLNRERKKKK